MQHHNVLIVVQLSSAAQLLGGAFHVGSLEDAAAVGPALKALTSSALPQPLLATLASPRIKVSQQVLLVLADYCILIAQYGCSALIYGLPCAANCLYSCRRQFTSFASSTCSVHA